MEEIQGIVTSIIYKDEETGFYVFKFEDEDDGRTKKAKGNFTVNTPYKDQKVVLKGEWESTKYGPTFSVETLERGEIETIEGIRKYLINYVNQVGEVTAKRLTDHFGQDTLDVLNNNPDRLSEVPDLNSVQRENLAEEFRKTNEYREVAIELLEAGLNRKAVRNAYEMWGLDATDKIKEDPYILLDLHGVGFKTADNVALGMGLDKDDPSRITASIKYTLQKSQQRGSHLYLHLNEIISKTRSVLRRKKIDNFGRELTTEDLKNSLRDLINDDQIVVEDSKVYLEYNYRYEDESAELLSNFVETHDMDVDIESFIDRYESNHGIKFSDKQREAIEALSDHRVLLLTGLPGTGKSTLTKAFVRLFQDQNMSYDLMSPTGIAAKNLSNIVGDTAATIHRALGYRGDENNWVYNESHKLKVDAVVVDEISMVDQHVFYRLLKALSNDTFLVLVGDHAQLPSVGAGNVLHELIRSESVKRVNLTEIFRQEEASDIVINAHRINNGQKPVLGDPNDTNTDLKFISKNSNSEIIEGVLKVMEMMADNEGEHTYQSLSPRWGGDLGVNRLNEEIREVLNPLENQQEMNIRGSLFREGDRIMITSNDYERGVYNGEVGVVRSIDKKERQLNLRIEDYTNDKLIEVPFSEVNDLLTLAFTTTIHKVQGLELDYIIFPFVDEFGIQLQRNLLYTALTRAKKKVFVFGNESAIMKAVENDRVQDRNTEFASKLRRYSQ